MEQIPNDHTYLPLNHSQRELRLLTLLPGENYYDDIDCHLHHVSLEEHPVYEALSYTWGDISRLKKILLDGLTFLVTEALEIAMRHIRNKDKPRTLWIDAICINQADVVERGIQVRIMKEICSATAGVIIWLGPSNGPKHRFWKLPDPLDHHICGSCCPSWWRRIWIIQEIVMARGIALTSITVETCGHYAHERRSRFGFWDFRTTKDLYLTIRGVRDAKARGEPMSLLTLLETFRPWEATDLRDKVYALLGLTTTPTSDFPIDYHKPVESVYMDLALFLIDIQQNLDVLGYIGPYLGMYAVHLPSWAPDWSVGGYRDRHDIPRISQPENGSENSKALYSASAGHKPRIYFEEPDRLSVLGVAIGTVQDVGAEGQPSNDVELQLSLTFPTEERNAFFLRIMISSSPTGRKLLWPPQEAIVHILAEPQDLTRYGELLWRTRMAKTKKLSQSYWKGSSRGLGRIKRPLSMNAVPNI